jgi:hypothetical protein
MAKIKFGENGPRYVAQKGTKGEKTRPKNKRKKPRVGQGRP